MNLKDFYRVLSKTNSLLAQFDTTPHYQLLIQTIDQARANPAPENQAAVKTAASELFAQNQAIEQQLLAIPHSQTVIESLGINTLLGAGANERVQQILSDEQFIATTGINELMNQFGQLRGRVATVVQQLDQFGLKVDDTDETGFLLSFTFSSDDVVSSKDVRDRLETIEEITHAFARLADAPEAFASPNIVSISKSSPLIIDVGNGMAIAGTLVLVGRTIKWILDRTKQILELRLMHEDIKTKQIKNKELEKGFKSAENDLLSEKAIADYASKLVKGIKSSDDAGVVNEKEKAIAAATKKLVELISEGNDIQVYLPVQDEKTEDGELTVEIAQLSHQLENVSSELKILSAGKKATKTVEEAEDKQTPA